ncbi:uncharacterized protein LOC121956045 [Plectropomus leopardus]|uniref:uncharacterized protein LOC121956045 n=1 Tax=Plectropomus leopardus TaxID=160734 RepID=UPI001C4D4456|nr:uncharacterized protein LOC121956045 [Plectropomus leopardus]
MPLKNNTLYFVVTLTSTLLCCAAGAVFVARPELYGNLHLRSLVSDRQHATAAPTRHGSLSFKFYQQGDHRSSPVFHNLMTAKLKRKAPSVHCGDNLMTLMLKGIRAPHILVDSGEGPRIPLSQMPSECGFSVKRSRRDVHFAAPYEGCHVTQQGGNYVLPLRLWGAPMTMSCPAALPPPSVSCFPSGMVVKMSGITANDLKVKVSGMWRSLSSVCGSCGIAVEMLSGGLTLIAPYNRGLCIKMKDEEYLLSLLLADAELLVTCPSLPDIKPTTAATTPPSDSGQVLQYPQYHQFPVFSQYPVFPGPAAPNKGAAAPSSQHPQLLSGAARDSDTENQEASAAQHPAFPFLPHFSQYRLFPRPVPPTQSPATKNTAAPPAKQPQVPQSPHYPFFFSHISPWYLEISIQQPLLLLLLPLTQRPWKPHLPPPLSMMGA